MGIFIVLIAPREDEDEIVRICEKYKIEVSKLGHVERGKRQVVIKPKKIIYSE